CDFAIGAIVTGAIVTGGFRYDFAIGAIVTGVIGVVVFGVASSWSCYAVDVS
ncbi:18249_t:CDS:2, partial [Dentiscutata erythropus]